MDAAAHVLDLHVPQPGRGGPYAVGGRQGLQALAVPDVEGQSQWFGVAQFGAQAVEVGQCGQ